MSDGFLDPDASQQKLGDGQKAKRMSTARDYGTDMNTKAREYSNKYLHKNKLGMYLSGYKKLDDIINLFFINYAKLDRSSLNCARLWVAVMHCRTQMTNAITHLTDQPRFIAVEYKELRMRELNEHIYPCRIFVAKAVQYIVTFIKHEGEDWRFLRKGFLELLSNHLSDALFAETQRWTDFIIDAYEIDVHTASAYKNHLKSQERKVRQALKIVEPKSKIAKKNFSLSEKLTRLYNERTSEKVKENDYFKLRVALNTVTDCLGTEIYINEVPKDDLPNENFDFNATTDTEGDSETIDTVKSFLMKAIPKVLEEDDKIWPHQKGLEDLGPFQLVDLKDPAEYLDINHDTKTYKLRSEFARIHGLSVFQDRSGVITELSPITLVPNELKALGINRKAKTFCWMFPIYTDPKANLDETVNFANDFSPLHVACLYGSFAYYDEKGTLLNVKGVTMGDDLFFDGPYFIPNPNVFNDLETAHVPFEKVTLAPILAMGAVAFGWVNPGQDGPFRVHEVNGGSDVCGWKFRGAFAYMYNNDGKGSELSKRRNYFQVLTFQEVRMKRQKNVNTPIVSSLRILFHTYQNQWHEYDEDNTNRTTWEEVIFQSSRGLNMKAKGWRS